MSEIAQDSAEALLKLELRIGGLEFHLSPAEADLIRTACGEVALASAIDVAGPAPMASFNVTGPYKPTATLSITVQVDAETPVPCAVVGDGKMTTGTIIRELTRQISAITNCRAKSKIGTSVGNTIVEVSALGDATNITLSALSFA